MAGVGLRAEQSPMDVVRELEVLVVAALSDHESLLTMRFSSIWALAMPK